jgi:hypothetical protein
MFVEHYGVAEIPSSISESLEDNPEIVTQNRPMLISS